MNYTVKNNYNEKVLTGNRKIEVLTGTHTEDIKGDTKITVTTGSLTMKVAANTATYESQKTTKIDSAADVHIVAKTQIALDVGASHLLMEENGNISIRGENIQIIGNETVVVSGDTIEVKGGKESKIGVGGQNSVYNTEGAGNYRHCGRRAQY
jgi:hypothetical protein